MTIDCTNLDLEQFANIIAGLVARGLGFKADAGRMIITLTGAC